MDQWLAGVGAGTDSKCQSLDSRETCWGDRNVLKLCVTVMMVTLVHTLTKDH